MHRQFQPDRMPRERRAVATAGPVESMLAQLALAVAVSAAAWALRLALDPWLDSRQTYSFAFAAVAVAAWLGSWKSGAIAAVICHLWASYFFIAPLYPAGSSQSADWIGGGTYYLIAGVLLLLGHRANALALTTAALRKADSRKAEFLAVLAHELRNPLATVRTGLELLNRCPSADTLRATTARMERQVAQMTRLVEDLLDIARIDRGKIQLHVENLPVDAALAEAVAASATFVATKGQQVRVEIEPGVRMIEADPARVTQVLTNLLHNASKFSPPGSTIQVCASPAGSNVAISVRDEGMGIATGQLDLIFDSFVQVDSGAQAGLGLGLSLVRKLMEMQGGAVEARSDGLGKGAEFKLTFRRSALMTGSAPLPQLLPQRGAHDDPERDTAPAQPPGVASIPTIIEVRAPQADGVSPARRLKSQVVEARRSRCPMPVVQAGEKDAGHWPTAGLDTRLIRYVSVADLQRAMKASRASRPP